MLTISCTEDEAFWDTALGYTFEYTDVSEVRIAFVTILKK
jgi:hypothetical protein